MTRKHTLSVPKCADCRFVAFCKVKEIDRRSLACLWNHYNYQAVENYWLQWETGDWAYDYDFK
jgi:hypothetical protein